MKIVIAGAGSVGLHLTKMFSDHHHDITIIDIDEQKSSRIDSQYDVLTCKGSATSVQVLNEVNMKNTDLFISVTEREEVNIMSCLLAKKLGASKTVARVDSQEYLTVQNRHLLEDLGVDHVTYPQRLTALEIVNLIRETSVTETTCFAGGKLSLFGFKLDESATVIGKTLSELSNSKVLDYRVVAIERNQETIIPSGDFRIELGDLVYVVSNNYGTEELLRFSGKKPIHVKNVMILGGSRIGHKTAKELQDHFNVKLIELDEKRCFTLADELTNTLVLQGDGRDAEFLEEEGIGEMDAFIAVTGNSDTNIIASLLAKKMGVARTISEIENLDYLQIAENVGLDTIVNKKFLAASSIYAYTLSADVCSMKYLTGTNAEILEFIAHEGSKIISHPLREITFPKNAIVGGVVRGKKGMIAKGDTVIQDGDRVVVFALPGAEEEVEKIFR